MLPASTPPPLVPTPPYKVATTPEETAELCAALSTSNVIGVDIETYAPPGAGDKAALDHRQNRIRLVQVSGQDGSVAIFDLDALHGLPVPLETVLRDEKIQKVFYNARFDAGGLLHHFGVEVVNIVDLLAGAVLITGYADHRVKGVHTLQAEVLRHLGFSLPKDLGASDWSAPVLALQQLDYAARDAAVLLPLYEKIRAEIARRGLCTAWSLENGVIAPVVAMENAGFRADRQKLEELVVAARADAVASASASRLALSAPNLNVNSPKQIIAAIKSRHGIDLKNTSEEVLESITAAAPAAFHILAARRAASRANAATAYAEAVGPNGRVHARFNPLAAPTGRFGCKEPNLLAVPRDGAFRSCFIAQPGSTLVVADYSAIQLRIIADQVQDPELLRCFCGAEPVDPHKRTAAEMLGKPVDLVTPDERKQAKPVNFGFAFGMGAARFVFYARDNYGVVLTVAQAIAFRNAFFRVYPSIRAWHRRVSATAAGTTEVRTASGRLRILRTVNGRPPFTEILNTPVQGTEADGVKRAMALLHPRLKEFGARLIAVVHDEFVVETPAEMANTVKAMVVEEMVSGMAEFVRSVPIVVEAKISPTWSKP